MARRPSSSLSESLSSGGNLGIRQTEMTANHRHRKLGSHNGEEIVKISAYVSASGSRENGQPGNVEKGIGRRKRTATSALAAQSGVGSA
jgi:hypothetical protein